MDAPEQEATMDRTPRRSWSQRNAETKRDSQGTDSSAQAFERHYSVEELAGTWGMSVDFVRRLFLREAGVVVFWRQRPGRRVYRTLRIPESVAERVHRMMTKR
jgi:hypothetical protein